MAMEFGTRNARSLSGLDWINLAQGLVLWRASKNIIMHIRVL